LRDIAPVWEALWRSCPTATPFQTPAWLLSWWEYFHPGDLNGYIIESKGQLVAFAPFYREGNLLKLMGIGISDYLDGLCRPEFAHALLSCVDQPAEFRQLRRCSPFFADNSEPDQPCPLLEFSAIPKRMTQNIHYYTRRAEREGSVTWESVDYHNLRELLEGLIDLHTAEWQTRGRSGVLSDSDLRAFHRAAAPRLLEAGVLRMYGLRLNGRIIGVFYGFFHNGRLYCYLSGFSPDHQHVSPGTLLVAHAIQCARSEGATTLDFLRGEEPYKFLWGAQSQATYRRIIDQPAS